MATSILPGIYSPDFADKTIKVDTEEAFEMVKRLAREEGLFVGASSGAAMVATLKVAEEIDNGSIVVIFPDGGDKYLSTRMFSDIF
jgi:cysteine synthase B